MKSQTGDWADALTEKALVVLNDGAQLVSPQRQDFYELGVRTWNRLGVNKVC